MQSRLNLEKYVPLDNCDCEGHNQDANDSCPSGYCLQSCMRNSNRARNTIEIPRRNFREYLESGPRPGVGSLDDADVMFSVEWGTHTLMDLRLFGRNSRKRKLGEASEVLLPPKKRYRMRSIFDEQTGQFQREKASGIAHDLEAIYLQWRDNSWQNQFTDKKAGFNYFKGSKGQLARHEDGDLCTVLAKCELFMYNNVAERIFAEIISYCIGMITSCAAVSALTVKRLSEGGQSMMTKA